MHHKPESCAVCGGEIRIGRYSDVTAGGVITNTYRAWGHVEGEVVRAGDVVGWGDRGSDRPRPHWAHPKGHPSDGVVRSARVRVRMRAPEFVS